jgi:hypothetical protein
MRKQRPTGVPARTLQGGRQVRRRTFRAMEIAALIDACGHFVAQLDTHQVGAAISLCVVALAVAGGVVIAVALTMRAMLASCGRVTTGERPNKH